MIKTSRMIIYLTPFICSRLKFYLLAVIGNYDSEPQLSLFFFLPLQLLLNVLII